MPGLDRTESPPECHTDRDVAAVCGDFSVFASEIIGPASIGSDQVQPATIVRLPDGRYRYEEHRRESRERVEAHVESFTSALISNGWSPAADNAPPSLRFELRGPRSYRMAVELRADPTGQPAASEDALLVHAVIETLDPIP